MGILLFELFRNPLFMGILNKWETLVKKIEHAVETMRLSELEAVAYDLFVKGYLSEP